MAMTKFPRYYYAPWGHVSVRRDADWDEYILRVCDSGGRQLSSYHTDDLRDAHSTARAIVAGPDPQGRTVQYRTGRSYGAPQVLRIVVPRCSPLLDDFDFVPVYFADDVRGIRGTVRVLALDLAHVGPVVLSEYDAGRYKLAPVV